MSGSPPTGPDANTGAKQIDVLELLSAILRHKALIVLCTLLSSAAVMFYSATKEPVFNAEGRVALDSGGFQSGFLSEVAVLSPVQPPESKEAEILGSRKLVRMVAAHPLSTDGPEFAQGLGIGLSIKVDDFDRYWPEASILRRFTGGSVPNGSLEMELLQPYTDPWTHRIELEFLAEGEVLARSSRIAEPETIRFDPNDTEPIVTMFGRRYKLMITGTLSGRKFGVTLRNLDATVGDLLSRLRIRETSRGSGVLQITYSDTSPSRAQRFVNRLAEMYVAYKHDRLAAQAGATEAFVSKEIERIQGELDAAEDEIVKYQEANETPVLPEVAKAIVEQQSSLTLELARLRLTIRAHELVAERLQDPEASLMSLAGAIELDPLLQSLFQALQKVDADAAELAIEYTDEWPALKELRERSVELRGSIRDNLASRLEGLRSQESTLLTALDEYDVRLDGLPRAQRELIRLQREASSHEAVYLILMQRLQEAKIAQAATIEQVEIIDRALPPRLRALPNVRANLVVGILLGLAIGSILALARESFTRRIRSAAQLEATTQLPVLGTIPDFRRGLARSQRARGKVFLALLHDPESAAAEAYRSLRASLRFATGGREIRTMAITSAGQGEGKSTTLADLAIALAQGGKKVLLVDADLRRPVVHKYFDAEVSPGLSEVLLEKNPWQDCVHKAPVANLDVLPAGAMVKNPGDLLASEGLVQLTESFLSEYDRVLFDVPPVLAVADASAFLHNLEAIFLLCRSNLLPEAVIEQATHRLRVSGAPAIGAILNGHRPSRLQRDYSSYGYGYGYSYKQEGRSSGSEL